MKRALLIGLLMSFFIPSPTIQAQDIDQELSALATKLASDITRNTKKKVTVIDFTDLQGGATELGKYIAEQLTVELVTAKKDFSVLDRANLKSILAEHKLTATGLVDPENAKKLGMFAGVDTIVLGTIIPKNQKFGLTAKIITTDTAEIIGAARAEFKSDDNIKELVSKPAAEGRAGFSQDEKPSVTKTLGDLRIEFQALRILTDDQLLLTMTITNTTRKSLWMALSADSGGSPIATLLDFSGEEFFSRQDRTVGIECVPKPFPDDYKPTEVRPREPVTVTMKFSAGRSKKPSKGQYNLQLELLIASDYNGRFASCAAHNFIVKLEAN